MNDLEQTVEIPKATLDAQLEEMRRRNLINAGLVDPIGSFTQGGMLRRQAD